MAGDHRVPSLSRLREVCEAAARSSFPEPVWSLEFVPRPDRVAAAVLAFTGAHIVAADLDETEARARLDPDDIAAVFNPVFLAWLGARLGARPGHIDVSLARLGSGRGDDWLRPVTEPPDNERVRRARDLRSEVVFLAPPEGGAVVTLGVGLGGRRELSMEIGAEADRNIGLGTRLVSAAVARVAADEAVFASVAPGNTRSLRCLLRAGSSPSAPSASSSPLNPGPRDEPSSSPSQDLADRGRVLPMIFIVVKFTVRPQYGDEWLDRVDDFTQATRREPGNLWFEWSRSVDDPNQFVLLEAFRDGAAGGDHVASEHFNAAIRALPPLLARIPEIVNVEVPGTAWSDLAEMSVSE